MWLADLFKTSPSNRFYDLLVAQSALALDAAQKLALFVEGNSSVKATDIEELEHRGDDILTQLIDAISDTFVTPLDRQDLYNLGQATDDMIDYINSAAAEITLFKTAPTPAMRAMCGVLVDGAHCLQNAVNALAAHRANGLSGAREAASQASRAENRMEELYRSTLAELFEGDDVRTMLKLREVYRHLSNSADRVDAIGKLITKIIVKTS